MKLTKEKLKQIIIESIEEQLGEPPADPAPPEQDARQKKVTAATTSGDFMSAEEYAQMLKQVLLTSKVTATERKKALEAIFGEKGTTINTLVVQMLQMLKGVQE